MTVSKKICREAWDQDFNYLQIDKIKKSAREHSVCTEIRSNNFMECISETNPKIIIEHFCIGLFFRHRSLEANRGLHCQYLTIYLY